MTVSRQQTFGLTRFFKDWFSWVEPDPAQAGSRSGTDFPSAIKTTC